jgi:hypothetical protein
MPRPLIQLDPSDKVLTVVATNLDLDSDIEQIIAVKRPDNVDAPVRILIADSNSVKGRYFYRSWESATGANSSRLFSLTVSDLIGDHGQQIVVSGMNAQGLLTLDVFAKDAPSGGQNLAFHSVCGVAANDIRIIEVDRGDQYTIGDKNGASFPIIADYPDPASDNTLDLIRVTYGWKYSEGSFVAGPEEKVPGERIVQKKLEDLYKSQGAEGFEGFISGAWVSYGDTVPTSSNSRPAELINFDPAKRRIARYMGDIEEIYVWSESYRVWTSKIIASAKSEPVPTIARSFIIDVTSIDTIEIKIEGSDLGEISSAVYVRLPDSVERAYYFKNDISTTLPSSILDGEYTDSKDLTIEFRESRVTWKQGDTERSGSFAIFSLGTSRIVTIRFASEADRPSDIRNFLLEASEKRIAGRLVKKIVLSPVQLIVRGYEDAAGDALSLDLVDKAP